MAAVDGSQDGAALRDGAALPDPGGAGTLDELVEQLRRLKLWAGDPSYDTVKDRVNARWTAAGRPASELVGKTTVLDCFRLGRRRLNADLLVAVVQALHPDVGYAAQWRQTLQIVNGESSAASQVRVQDVLPPDLTGFTGRSAELDRLRRLLGDGPPGGGAVVISAIEGMAGVGKTQLAVHAAHRLIREQQIDQVLFVDLRGFHPDPGQPPVDPAAVLDGFLRLLGVPGQEIPHDLDTRAARYRGLVAGSRVLVILDNAADEDQVRPLLPEAPGCPVLVTSRRSLTGLSPATRLIVDVFAPDEARQLLASSAPEVPAGDDSDALDRIARRCGHLPLALQLMTGHMRARPGWSLADHADWLVERHEAQRLDAGVELAFGLSYQDLPADRRRLLRILALHPGHDLDAYAAAALAGTDLDTVRDHLRLLCAEHMLQQGMRDRYTFHDLIRAFAVVRAHDEERPAERRAALTRLFDYYLATAAAAMDTLHPADAGLRPRLAPAGTPGPALTDPDTAVAWLDIERPTLIAVAAHTAAHGWPTHTTRLARTMFRYLAGGHNTDAVIVHGHAERAAHRSGDTTGQAHALADLGTAWLRQGRRGPAAGHYERALRLFRQTGDAAGLGRTVNNLGIIAEQSGRYQDATAYYAEALELHRANGNRTGEASTLTNLGNVERLLGRYPQAIEHYEQALALCRRSGDRDGEAFALHSLGEVETRSGRHDAAGDHLLQARALYRHLGNRDGEAWTLGGLGQLQTCLGQPARATGYHQQALTILRATGDREAEVAVLNGLGEAARADDRPADARAHHTTARAVAADVGVRDQLARADAGLGHSHRALGELALAREHYRLALALYTDLGMPEADEIRAHLSALVAREPGEGS